MRLFQAPLDTCLDSPFFASLSVHGLHFTIYAPSNFSGPRFISGLQTYPEGPKIEKIAFSFPVLFWRRFYPRFFLSAKGIWGLKKAQFWRRKRGWKILKQGNRAFFGPKKGRKGQKIREAALFSANPRFFGKKAWKGGSGLCVWLRKLQKKSEPDLPSQHKNASIKIRKRQKIRQSRVQEVIRVFFGNSSLEGYESSKTLVLMCFGVQSERDGRSVTDLCWLLEPFQGRKNSININFLARISCGHSWPLRPNAQGSKGFSPPPGPQENALFGADVHDFRRGRPWPEGLLKNFLQKSLRWFFCP